MKKRRGTGKNKVYSGTGIILSYFRGKYFGFVKAFQDIENCYFKGNLAKGLGIDLRHLKGTKVRFEYIKSDKNPKIVKMWKVT